MNWRKLLARTAIATVVAAIPATWTIGYVQGVRDCDKVWKKATDEWVPKACNKPIRGSLYL